MTLARSRSLTVTADGANNQTPWCTCKLGGQATITAPGTMTGTVTLQRQAPDGSAVDVFDASGTAVTFTKKGSFPISSNMVAGMFRLNCKSGAFSAGPWTMTIEGR